MDTRSATAAPQAAWVGHKLPRIAGAIGIIGAITVIDHILSHLK